MPQRGMLFVFSGPSGAGKNTIMHRVLEAEPRLRQLPTATTREPRATEQQGREHEFLTEVEFRQRILDKGLVEWQIIHDRGVYGVPRATVQQFIESGQLAVADVDVLGAMDLKREFGDNVVLIFVGAPDKATLERHLRERPDVKTEEQMLTRLRRADFEMSFAPDYDYQIVNIHGQLEDSVRQALEIVSRHIDNRVESAEKPVWDARPVRYRATGVVVQESHLLQHENRFPNLSVPEGQMPFDTLCEYLQSILQVELLPTRQYAEKRAVASGFEPPQLVRVTLSATTIDKNLIYILKPAVPIENLPSDWQWVSIDGLYLDEALQALVLEVVEDLQLDLKATEQ